MLKASVPMASSIQGVRRRAWLTSAPTAIAIELLTPIMAQQYGYHLAGA